MKIANVVVNEDTDAVRGIGNGAAFEYAVSNGLCKFNVAGHRICTDLGKASMGAAQGDLSAAATAAAATAAASPAPLVLPPL